MFIIQGLSVSARFDFLKFEKYFPFFYLNNFFFARTMLVHLILEINGVA